MFPFTSAHSLPLFMMLHILLVVPVFFYDSCIYYVQRICVCPCLYIFTPHIYLLFLLLFSRPVRLSSIFHIYYLPYLFPISHTPCMFFHVFGFVACIPSILLLSLLVFMYVFLFFCLHISHFAFSGSLSIRYLMASTFFSIFQLLLPFVF